tara:strand:- start:5313 stop:6101 length:789 start_codon:yes stop_codon:yes gene_type:complete
MWLSDSEQARNEATVSTLQEIGELIRQARIERGLSCDQLSESLKMGSEQLQALERGDLEKLPEPVFIKAMTRRVASKLGLDCDPLISRLQSVLQTSDTVSNGPGALSGGSGEASSEKREELVFPWQRMALAALMVGAVTGGAMVVASQRRSVQQASIRTSTVLNVDTQTRHQAVAANDRIKEPAEGVISISSKEPSWLSIRNGEGKVIFEGTLSESRSLPAQPDLEIYAGRPDLVLVSRGDDAPKALGPINQVRWYRLSPEL